MTTCLGKHLEHPMSSVQKCAEQIQEQVYKMLMPQIHALDDELQIFNKLLANGIQSIGYKLEALRQAEFPISESILDDYLQDAMQKQGIEEKMLTVFIRGLRTKETQEEILDSLLDNAVNCFPRVALFAVRGEMLKGWSSRGFSDFAAVTISLDEFRQADCSWLPESLMNGNHAECADLPAIGLQTVEQLKINGLKGIAVEAGGIILIEREAVIKKADESGIFIIGLKITPEHNQELSESVIGINKK